jgi:hypothetical protein
VVEERREDMKGRRILVSIVASLALVGVAAPAHADAQSPSGMAVSAGSTVMGVACNVLNNILGLPLCK